MKELLLIYNSNSFILVAGEDYYSDTVVHFENGLNGDDEQCFQVSILNDSVVEDTESFNISITVANQIYDVTQPSSAVVSIVDNNGNVAHDHNYIYSTKVILLTYNYTECLQCKLSIDVCI